MIAVRRLGHLERRGIPIQPPCPHRQIGGRILSNIEFRAPPPELLTKGKLAPVPITRKRCPEATTAEPKLACSWRLGGPRSGWDEGWFRRLRDRAIGTSPTCRACQRH